MADATVSILDMLNDDMVSHGLVVQCLQKSATASDQLHGQIRNMLTNLLSSGSVDVGEAKLSSPEHVEFIAWNGSVEGRVERALAAIDTAAGPDKEFAYWLCLRQNIDRVEDDR
ncbi:hypothetical protein [Planctomycetes bacterium Pan216]|uniref:hypothetical protein n=1 Tax=Kolteria novifilia TaxID=2527975 RepID=UPI00119D1976